MTLPDIRRIFFKTLKITGGEFARSGSSSSSSLVVSKAVWTSHVGVHDCLACPIDGVICKNDQHGYAVSLGFIECGDYDWKG